MAKKVVSVKFLAVMMSAVLVLGGVIGGTFAWLIDETEEVVNTFTYGDINIELDETDTDLDDDGDLTTNQYEMVPGREITKDPEVTVLADNEATWLFVKLTKSDDFDNFMTYEVDDSVWKLLPEDTANDLVDVYYMFVGEDTDNTAVKYGVLKDDKVTVKEDVTKAALNALTDYPTLNVQAFAIQYENFEVVDGTTGEDVADPSGLDAAVTDEFAVAAWNVIQGQTNP